MKYIYSLSSVIILMLISLTCRKDGKITCTDKNTIQINQHALDYFYFKEGTWWVYEEEGTGNQDSVWVSNGNRYFENPWELKKYCRCNRGKCVETAYMRFENAENNMNLNQQVLYRYKIEAGWQDGEATISEGSGAYFSASSIRFEFVNNQPKSPTWSGGGVENMKTINIKDEVYENIMHIYYANEDVDDWLQEAWYAKNIYLVKFRKNDNTTWNLVKYNIVK
ncbi:MAG: hypothetical protein EOP53_07260 [Sphingobacteriales bacterium]|nr:MAG: hypothetical protein EOP53_07260 [Sphingobacteriales bacterium]